MTLTTVCAVAVIAAFAAYALRAFGWQGVPLLSVLAMLLLVREELSALGAIVPQLLTLNDGATPYISAALRIVGIGYLASLTADICRDLGEVGIGRAVGMVAKAEILVIALPFFKSIVEMGMTLLS